MAKLDCHVYGIPQSMAGHTHPYAHILLPLTDTLEVRLQGSTYHMTNCHLGFVAPGCYHHCLCAAEIIMINIPAAMIIPKDLEVLASPVCRPIGDELLPITELIKAEARHNPHSDSLRYLYYYLYDKLVETGSSKSLRYIREHFGEDISVATLARLENYNVSYFTDWFKKQTGSSPSGYIRGLRMEKAKELLTTTQYRLLAIALQVGYHTSPSFTRAFKETTGISPRDYRRRYRLENPQC